MDNSLESIRDRREILWDRFSMLYKAEAVTANVGEKATTCKTVFFVAKIHYTYVTNKAY